MGAVIRIGNSSYKVYDSNSDGILLSLGLKTNIVIGEEFKSILSKPYSNCEIDSMIDLFQFISVQLHGCFVWHKSNKRNVSPLVYIRMQTNPLKDHTIV